jgi:hypothetical protein
MMPVRIAAGWSRDDTNPVSLAIRYLNRPGWAPRPIAQWSHQFIVFEFADGSRVIHEALMDEGWCRKGYMKLDLWLAKSPKNHHAEVHWLPIKPEHIEEIYKKSCGWLGTKSYACRQIAALAVVESLVGRYLGLSVADNEQTLICSEGGGRLLIMAGPEWDPRKPGESCDRITPQSLYNHVMALLYGSEGSRVPA